MTPSTPLRMSFARCVVEDLPRHGVEMETSLESADIAELERQEVEKQRSIGLRRQRNELPLSVGVRLVVNELQIGRLPAQTGAIVDDLAVYLSRSVVDERHSSVLSFNSNRKLFTKEAVDVLVGDLRKRRLEVRPNR